MLQITHFWWFERLLLNEYANGWAYDWQRYSSTKILLLYYSREAVWLPTIFRNMLSQYEASRMHRWLTWELNAYGNEQVFSQRFFPAPHGFYVSGLGKSENISLLYQADLNVFNLQMKFASASAYYFTGANESWSEARRVLWGLTCQLWNTQTKPGSGAHQIGHAQQICMRAQAALLSGYCDVARRATAIPKSQCSLITVHTHQIIMQITFQPLTMQTAWNVHVSLRCVM